ncbi:MAG: D-cysteine desulfhydrase family protein [Deltaproteobacteria bacterium]|nr:MAG: D-cysteine desulfhydrase family protein [Deltaproteobacteria bacterium]
MIEPIFDREPPRVRLANLPTRGHWLRFGQTDRPRGDERVRIWIKRDDHTGSELMGNKVRKLEYLMAEAIAEQATHVITCGGEQSNHARATAFAAAQLGMKSLLILRTDDPENPPSATGNILLDRLVGAELQWISRAAWRDRNQLLAEAADRVRRAGDRPYVVPEGGSNALGSWGYLRAMHELADDLAGIASPEQPVTVVYACGSGGTAAGLILGAKLLRLAERGIRLAGINVCDDRAYFLDVISRICADAEARWQLGAHVTEADIDIVDGHVGRGYARSRPEELATIRDVCRSDGIVLDPVYTGKAFHGMLAELAADPARFGSAVAFLHTGGLFGLFAPSDIAGVL